MRITVFSLKIQLFKALFRSSFFVHHSALISLKINQLPFVIESFWRMFMRVRNVSHALTLFATVDSPALPLICTCFDEMPKRNPKSFQPYALI